MTIPVLSWLAGRITGEVVKEGAKAVGNGVSNILDRIVPKKMSESDRIDKYAQLFGISEASTADARKMFMVEMQTQKQPWLIRMLNGFVRPFGGIGSLATEFYGVWGANIALWFGFPYRPIVITIEQHVVFGTIIAFYFGSRLKETLSGVTTRR